MLTVLAMVAFAANSVLCRAALQDNAIDATSFTLLRLGSGALALALIATIRGARLRSQKPTPGAMFMLFAYALCFAFAYIELSTATGALILFGAVQLTMILIGLIQGNRPSKIAWAGSVLAVLGLIYLLLPGVDTPSLIGALLMAAAGIAWGFYSLYGKQAGDPVISTTWNFIGAFGLASAIYLISNALDVNLQLTSEGVILAILSGALASGVGYVIWYSALPQLSSITAASVQLSVPVIAAFGGTVFMSEAISARLVTASICVLGGIALVIVANTRSMVKES
jgi:drug/metabolite transporter (DMT)-like permease